MWRLTENKTLENKDGPWIYDNISLSGPSEGSWSQIVDVKNGKVIGIEKLNQNSSFGLKTIEDPRSTSGTRKSFLQIKPRPSKPPIPTSPHNWWPSITWTNVTVALDAKFDPILEGMYSKTKLLVLTPIPTRICHESPE